MNDNNTNITYEHVIEDANIIKDCSKKMGDIFSMFEETMNQLKPALIGEAGNAVDERFRTLKGKFDSYTAKVELFSNMISSAADRTQATEQSIARDADNLAG